MKPLFVVLAVVALSGCADAPDGSQASTSASVSNPVASAPTNRVAPVVTSLPSASAAPARKPGPQWLVLADRGKHDKAYEAMGGHAGLVAAIEQARTPALLSALVEVAAINREWALQERGLRRAADEFPDSNEGRVAVFHLAKYDKKKNPWVATYQKRDLEPWKPIRVTEESHCAELDRLAPKGDAPTSADAMWWALAYLRFAPQQHLCFEKARLLVYGDPPEPGN